MEKILTYDKDRLLPPYGPTRGMIQGLELMERLTPLRVDEDFLRANRVAPGNEYKVVGGLRFLGLIDEDGRPTERSRQLKTRGPIYILALQEMVRAAYGDLFTYLGEGEVSRERIYNYFVTKVGMGAEMALKAARFFIALCRRAEMEMGPEPQRKIGTKASRPRARPTGGRQARPKVPRFATLAGGSANPLVLVVTPEVARMEENELVDVFRKLRRALGRALADEK